MGGKGADVLGTRTMELMATGNCLQAPMTTLTIVPDEDAKSTSTSFNPTHTIADIDPLIYGGFTEFVI